MEKKVKRAILKEQEKLKAKVKRKGIYENFGQTEVRKLRDKFSYITLNHYNDEERKVREHIDAFTDWCLWYNGM